MTGGVLLLIMFAVFLIYLFHDHPDIRLRAWMARVLAAPFVWVQRLVKDSERRRRRDL